MPSASSETDLLRLRIGAKRRLAADIFGFELTSPQCSELPAFASGAHIGVKTPSGLLRKYSLCNAPAQRDRYVIAVKREARGRGGSISMTDDTEVGDEIVVASPRNDFGLVPSAAGHVFIAGGIGITPILSMIRHLDATEGRFKLYYLTRTPDHTAFRDELSAPTLRGRVTIHHDDGDPGKTLDLWPVLERPAGAHLYCCGPRALMDAVRDMTGHWPSTAVHFEAFTDAATDASEDTPFRIRLARSGETLVVPVGTSILETLRRHGHVVPSSCESGSCGTCKTGLLAGTPDHRDLVLAAHERGDHIMVCVSRARSAELVIDL